MPHAERVRRGDGFLPGVSLQDLQEMRDGERDPKARTILQAAIHHKTGLSLDEGVQDSNIDVTGATVWLALQNRTESATDDSMIPSPKAKPER